MEANKTGYPKFPRLISAIFQKIGIFVGRPVDLIDEFGQKRYKQELTVLSRRISLQI